jgi:hypothetical protein
MSVWSSAGWRKKQALLLRDVGHRALDSYLRHGRIPEVYSRALRRSHRRYFRRSRFVNTARDCRTFRWTNRAAGLFELQRSEIGQAAYGSKVHAWIKQTIVDLKRDGRTYADLEAEYSLVDGGQRPPTVQSAADDLIFLRIDGPKVDMSVYMMSRLAMPH